MSSDIDVSQYLNVFLEETKEHLQTLTQALIDLEGSDAESAAEALNEAFRAVHTIKGMSASMEFRNMEHLCHSVEDVLDELRSGSRGVTPEIIDLLLESSTKLEELTGSIEENGNDDIDVSAVLSELKNLLSGEEGKEKEKEKGNEERGSVQKRKTYEIKV
ncbi:MAG: Hpt domain-containing protein, partial [Methanophagales archaeon]|nr:Hpt domain-containing protein [Methanophagales archaeon]